MDGMTEIHFLDKLEKIATAARDQLDGVYTVESDSMKALELIEELARLMATPFRQSLAIGPSRIGKRKRRRMRAKAKRSSPEASK